MHGTTWSEPINVTERKKLNMMCFQDRTFCPAKTCAKFDICDRALTPKVLKAADKWWGEPGAPISRYPKPELLPCYEKEIPYVPED